jgi:hypothetical protein
MILGHVAIMWCLHGTTTATISATRRALQDHDAGADRVLPCMASCNHTSPRIRRQLEPREHRPQAAAQRTLAVLMIWSASARRTLGVCWHSAGTNGGELRLLGPHQPTRRTAVELRKHHRTKLGGSRLYEVERSANAVGGYTPSRVQIPEPPPPDQRFHTNRWIFRDPPEDRQLPPAGTMLARTARSCHQPPATGAYRKPAWNTSSPRPRST